MTKSNYRLVGFLFLVCCQFCAASTTTLTGVIKDASGAGLNGALIMQLPVPAQDVTTNTAVQNTPVVFKVINGTISGGAALYDVATLQPQNLYYKARAYDSAGNLVFYGNYAVTSASFNLGAATPTTITTSNVSFLSPVNLTGTNVFTGTNTFSGSTNLSGLATFTGGVVIGTDTLISASPRTTFSCFKQAASGNSNTADCLWTPDKAVILTRVQIGNTPTAPAGCATVPQYGVAVVSPLTTVAALNLPNGQVNADSGPLSVALSAGTAYQIGQIAADAGCGTHAGPINITLQYKMQ